MQQVRDEEPPSEEDDEEEYDVENFKVNWLAVFGVLIFLITVGFLLGKLAAAPDGQTLECPEEDWVQIIGTGQGDVEGVNHVIVYCEMPASN